MRTHILVLFGTALFALTANAQLDYSLIPYRKGKLWGYCDSTKKILVKPQFDKVNPFQQYEEGSRFPKTRVAIVSVKGKIGLINEKGQMLVPCKFNSAENVWFENNKMNCILFAGLTDNYLYNVYSKKIRKLLQTDTLFFLPQQLTELSFISPRLDDSLTLTKTGNEDFLVIRKLSNSPYSSTDIKPKGKNGNGYDSSIISALSLRKVIFSDSLLFVQKGTGWGLISLSGSMLIPSIYDSIYSVSTHHNVFAVQKNGKLAIICLPKNLSSDFVYDSVINNEESDGYLIQRNGKWGVLFDDLKKEILIDKVLYAKYFISTHDRLVEIRDSKDEVVGYTHFNGTKFWD